MNSRFKIILTFGAVFAFRLLPFRAPNVEPILASTMPLSKRYGMLVATLFSVLSIALYDAVTSGWGMWTLTTALSYGALGFASALYFKDRPASRMNFVRFSVIGILAYDFVTGPLAISFFDGQPFVAVVAAQIPFTILHLLGAVAFAALVSPVLNKWFAMTEQTSPAHVREALSR